MIENARKVSDYMVRDPVCAHLWQPVSLVRQQMLTNSFSYLPVQIKEDKWHLVSDFKVAKYLQGQSGNERKRRLARPLGVAVDAEEIALLPAKLLSDETLIDQALMKDFDGKPILVFGGNSATQLVGILTAFDLL
jgi:hypothetical protein